MKNASSSIRQIAASIVCAGLIAAAAGTAAADTKRNADFAFAFQFDQSELSTNAGAQKLLARLEAEVRAECAPPTRQSVEDQKIAQACIADTMKAAVSNFNSAIVAQAYQSRAHG